MFRSLARFSAAAFAASGLMLSPAVSRAESLEEVLVNKGVITQEEADRITDSTKVSYNNGLKLEWPDKGVGLGFFTLVQPRYQFTDHDSNSGREDSSSVQTRRARIYVSGSALEGDLTFNMMTDLVGTNRDGESSPDLQDLWVSYYPADRWELRLGQYLVPFSRESLISAKLQFPDFAVATSHFAFFRQPGAGAWYRNAAGTFLAGVSGYNGDSTGEGRNRAGNDTKHLGAANFRWSPLAKIDALEEGDIGMTPSPAFSLGGAYLYGESDLERNDEFLNTEVHGYNLDANFKMLGFSLHAELLAFDRSNDAADTAPLGIVAQSGYFVLPKTVELAVRYSSVDCDESSDGQCSASTDRVDEFTVGANYFFTAGHNFKAQLAWIKQLEDLNDRQDTDSSKVVLQLQMAM